MYKLTNSIYPYVVLKSQIPFWAMSIVQKWPEKMKREMDFSEHYSFNCVVQGRDSLSGTNATFILSFLYSLDHWSKEKKETIVYQLIQPSITNKKESPSPKETKKKIMIRSDNLAPIFFKKQHTFLNQAIYEHGIEIRTKRRRRYREGLWRIADSPYYCSLSQKKMLSRFSPHDKWLK